MALLAYYLQVLNETKIWIFRLGATLFFVALFYWLKNVFPLCKRLRFWYYVQRNIVKIVIIILVICLLFQAFREKDTVSITVNKLYHKTNFSALVPIELTGYQINSSKRVAADITQTVKDIGGTLTPEPRDVSVIESEILKSVNKERAARGVGSLTNSDRLRTYARSWSEKMITGNFFEHSKLSFSYNSIAAENIMETPIHYDVEGCGSTYSNTAMATCIVNGWIESPGHHANMIDPQFSYTGIGVACDSSTCKSTEVFSG
ncbi:MAG: CAP domain-containing protein [Candidatus Woesearchaeota archaeon]